MNTDRDITRKSAAATLSDMEMFIFPELIYSLVLANIMSPRLWEWRNDPWFAGLERMKPYRRIMRLKQYIMDHYIFNLDLDTWGLTTKEKETARFSNLVDPKALAISNALFGYEGDKYYFDIDIRTHFGLDKYEGNIIPYWKTETLEAMDAFRHKPGYNTGAGECVSLSTLYAAALFVVARIPLNDIYLMATPLHSQNFIDVNEGILTNNRRLVTKNMWFNGTALSAQARRAIENERITIVAHETGCMHAIYDKATINRDVYSRLAGRLKNYLQTSLTPEVLGNFLRHDHSLQKCFQLRWPLYGRDKYIGVERVLAYEHGSPYSLSDNTRDKLMGEIEMSEFMPGVMKSRIILNDLEFFVKDQKVDINNPDDVKTLKEQFSSDCLNAEIALESLTRFCHIEPRIPDEESKSFDISQEPLGIDLEMGREEITERLELIRSANEMADMSFYALRDLTRSEAEPFLMAAVQRNPVSVSTSEGLELDAVLDKIRSMSSESIYDEASRLAQPDEVWNFCRGDGLEKAILAANIIRGRQPDQAIGIIAGKGQAVLKADSLDLEFPSKKDVGEQEWIIP